MVLRGGLAPPMGLRLQITDTHRGFGLVKEIHYLCTPFSLSTGVKTLVLRPPESYYDRPFYLANPPGNW